MATANPDSPKQQQQQFQHPPQPLALTSHNTALALIPPSALWPRLDRLRALYDKAYPAWPPHINLVYPFVGPDCLDRAVAQIGAALSSGGPDDGGCFGEVGVCLDEVGVFQHGGRNNTVYLCDGERGRGARVERLRRAVVAALGPDTAPPRNYKMHLTVAQSEDVAGAAHRFLVEKATRVPRAEWTARELCVLVRERVGAASRMRLWGTIALADGRIERVTGKGLLYQGPDSVLEGEQENAGEDEHGAAEKEQLQTRLPFYFEDETERWVPFRPSTLDAREDVLATLTVASYNVLAEFEWPPSEARYPLLIQNILADDAAADVLVLQEVTDGFLSHLLADQQIRDTYPFCSHGPPDQDDIEPLPSFLNIVVLSSIPFDWEYVSFRRKHKGAVVARFRDLGRTVRDGFRPLVLAAVHLSHGLTDGAVAAKKTDIKRIIRYLSDTYPGHAWMLAGDFNIATSSATVDAALKKKAISDLTARHLTGLDELFSDANLDDAWTVSLARDRDMPDVHHDDMAEGEQGATWDPTTNSMAAAVAGSGGNMRPQRYDRILVRGEALLEVSKFNMFGFPSKSVADAADSPETYASDHWGIRCTMNVTEFGDSTYEPSQEIASLVVPVHLQKAPETLARPGSVKETLAELGVIPSEEEAAKRKEALKLLESTLLDTSSAPAATRSRTAVVVVPVGSYALDVWTGSSDMDVLCIGPFSTNTFFALASRRLRKAAAQGIKILRRVRAHTGTMLEIEVRDIKMDLQYCPAAAVAERWPDVLRAPPSDPVWSLPVQTLSKLKAARDIDYLRRSLPDLAAFRVAHRFIKTWAKSRGIYSARFGFLSGIQISVLLARVCKLLVRESGPCSVEDVLATFFAHYASFDWATQLAFDPLFHRQRLPYTRTSREPLAILGYFPPALNTAAAASVPSTRTLASEFRRARDALFPPATASTTTNTTSPCRHVTTPSWSAFLSSATATAAAANFLAAHRSYVRLDVQYWGLSPARGAQLLGWLESRCVLLLVDLHRRAPGLHARMWPARFVERAAAADVTEEQHGPATATATATAAATATSEPDNRHFCGCYLIGLDKADPSMGRDELRLALGALWGVLARFEAQMRGDGRYFDARCCWLGAAVVSRAELGGALEVDRREWGAEYTAGEEEDEEEEEEEDEEEEEEEEGNEGGGEGGTVESHDAAAAGSGVQQDDLRKAKKGKGKAAARRQVAAVDLRTDKMKKFRTAADVMNRIRWDPQLDSSDYVVGYNDRFVGPLEKELEAWKSELTDDEFIPQHRILYFKRRSDGRMVWDRRTRWDELFGSG